MRLPRVRFTVRKMMVAEAIIAILCGVSLQVERAFVSLGLLRFMPRSRQAGVSKSNRIVVNTHA